MKIKGKLIYLYFCFFILFLTLISSLEIVEINMIARNGQVDSEGEKGEMQQNLKGSIRIDVQSTNYTYPLGTRGASFIIKAGANFTNNQKSTQGHISVQVSSVDGCKNEQQGIVTNLSMTRYVASQYCKLGDDPLVADTSFRVYAQAWMDTGESSYGYGEIKIKVQKTEEQKIEKEGFIQGQGWMDSRENSYNYGQITLKVLKFSQGIQNLKIQKNPIQN